MNSKELHKGSKKLKCMNHDPANSKWGEYAPESGACEEVVVVDEKCDKVLCFRCTSRSVSGISNVN